MKPPIADKKPYKTQTHKIERTDNYHWMRLSNKQKNAKTKDKATKEVINYIVSHIERSFDSVYTIVKKIDDYSLSHSRDITIPLIKEII